MTMGRCMRVGSSSGLGIAPDEMYGYKLRSKSSGVDTRRLMVTADMMYKVWLQDDFINEFEVKPLDRPKCGVYGNSSQLFSKEKCRKGISFSFTFLCGCCNYWDLIFLFVP